jgi:N-methylhydantoinase A/oxoprolinase/acetone carboxylase beta subunit
MFRTVFGIDEGGTHTDIAHDTELQQLSWFPLGHVLHSWKLCADITHHTVNEMIKAVVKN